MAQAGKTPIQFYRSSTGGATPDSANLSAGELAINTADVAIYAENSSGVVKRLINNPAGLKYPTADGTASQVLVTDGSGNLSFATASSGTAYQAVASGSLSNGTKVIINSDGTVSAVAQTLTPPSVGTETSFESGDALSFSATYDSVAHKVIVGYKNASNSDYGTAVVGTVSGTSISFGTAVVFRSATCNDIALTYDSNAQKVVIAYRDGGNSQYGRAIIGTVSGTSISFGSPVTFNSANTQAISITYHSGSQKVVIAYRDYGNSEYGTAIVGSVSGTSISFGSESVFNSASTPGTSITYDSVNQKVVISYADGSSSNYGTAIVGTVSGTSISFGSSTQYAVVNGGITYDSNAQKVVIAYRDTSNSNYGTAIVGTVSGTSISFGTSAVFNAGDSTNIGLTYDSNAHQIIIAYRDVANSNYGTAIVGTISGTSISFGSELVFSTNSPYYNVTVYDSYSQKTVISYKSNDPGYGIVFTNSTLTTNLTSENYIGISNAAYTNGQTATIQTIGSVDDAQTSLTAGQAYYVQQDGTLSQTPDSPSVFAGTAVSSTKLIVKG